MKPRAVTHRFSFSASGLPNTDTYLRSVRTYTERWRYFQIGLLGDADTREAVARPAENAESSLSRHRAPNAFSLGALGWRLQACSATIHECRQRTLADIR